MKNLFEMNFDNCFQNDRNRLRLSTSYEWLNLGKYHAHTHMQAQTFSLSCTNRHSNTQAFKIIL